MSGEFCGIQSQLEFLSRPLFGDGLAASGRPVDTPEGRSLALLPCRLKDDAAPQRVEGRHSTPERVLHGNFRLACANLLKREQLEEKSCRQGAVEQPEVSAGELVDS
jgi:hypothetical protein